MAKGGVPLAPVQFNVLAVVLILIGLPVAVAAISSAGATGETKNWEPAYGVDTSGTLNYATWLRNGADFSDTYEAQTTGTGNCSYIEPLYGSYLSPSCAGSTPLSTPYPFLFFSTEVRTTNTGIPALQVPVDHNNLPPGDYIGSSGAGPFEWVMPAGNMVEIPTDEMPEAYRFNMLDSSGNLNCGSADFVNITFDGRMRFFTFDFATGEVLNDVSVTRTYESSNKLLWDYYDATHGWTQGCWIGLSIEFDLTSFESMELSSTFTNWSNVFIVLTLDDFEVDEPNAASNIGQTKLPFHGDTGTFPMVVEYATVDQASINFVVRGGTLVLGLVICLIAIGSTPYWDPLRSWFRGAF